MDPFPSTPGASSSRITLEILAQQEQEQEQDHQQEDLSSAPLRGSGYRRGNSPGGAITFVLGLCLPYIATAHALPSPQPITAAHMDHGLPSASSGLLAVMDLPRRIGLRIFPSSLMRRNLTAAPFSSQAYVIPGDFVVLEQNFTPGFIVLSYLIAFVGSLCTLELLIRRTSNAGWRNQVLLSSAGICFGAVSTFSMHFIFNNALTLHNPQISNDEPVALSYASGYTVLSLVASCTAMTLAFFVMGTSVSHWWCIPGSRRRRDSTEDEEAEIVRRQADEYKKWKSMHKKTEAGLGKASQGVGALMGTAAGMVAKWSLVEDPGRRSPYGAAGSGKQGKGRGWKRNSFAMGKVKKMDAEEKNFELGRASGESSVGPGHHTAEDQWIARDQHLSELDFRLGRTAARIEMDKRAEQFGTQTNTTAADSAVALGEPLSRLSVDNSLHHGDSTWSLPVPPTALRSGSTFYSSSRRASEAQVGLQSSPYSSTRGFPGPNGMFGSGYDFPPRLTIDSSTANLLTSPHRDSAPHSADDLDASGPWGRRGSIEPPVQYSNAGRRSSLPIFAPSTATREPLSATAPGYPFSNTLSRIQSLPEAEQDAMSSPSGSHGFQSFASPGLSTPQMEKGLGAGGKASDVGEVSFDVPDETRSSFRPPRFGRSSKARARAKGEEAEHREPHWLAVKAKKFLGFDVVTKGEVLKIVLTGTIAGFGVAAMHYIGQASIVGQHLIVYDPAYVVASIVIAAGAVVIALYIMFIMLRPKLKHGFAYKLCVAAILAVAVCCMHFCGMAGTTYAWPIGTPITKSDKLSGTNGAIVGIVSALAFAACLACGVFFFVEFLQARRERRRRRRVVVAAVMLDEQDRILVNSTDGLPPMCDIASLSGEGEALKPSKRSLGESHSSGGSTILGMDLTPGHEAFVSAMKLSWFWRNPETVALNPFAMSRDIPLNKDGFPLRPVLPSINTSIQEIRRGSLQTTSSTQGSRPSKISVTKFLERFVISAGQLAVRLTGQQDGIQRLGVLYDQILTTGWVKLSHSSDTVSKGQLIILVRRIPSHEEQQDLLARNFIFADSSAVAVALQRTLSVPLEHMDPLLKDVQRFCDSTTRVHLEPGMLYAGVAVVQATPFDGLRILLEQENRSQLPMRAICPFSTMSTSSINIGDDLSGTVEEIGEALTWLEGMNLLSIISRNVTSAGDGIGGPRVTQLLRALERAVVPMLDEMLNQEDMAHILPRLSLHPFLVPLTPGRPRPDPKVGYMPPYMIVLYANYDAAVNTFTDKWLPFSLFKAQNACVMAPAIAAAQRTVGYPTHDGPRQVGDVPAAGTMVVPEGFNPGRRPSKVQFDVPLASPTNIGITANPTAMASGNNNNGSPSPSPGIASTGELPSPSGWATFTFPARTEDSAPPYTTTATSTQSDPADPSPTQAYTLTQPPPLSVPSHRLPTPRGGRRSSLAKGSKSREYPQYPDGATSPGSAASALPSASTSTGYLLSGSFTPGGGDKVKEREAAEYVGFREAEMPGVASWEAEWLLILLRTKLRAEA